MNPYGTSSGGLGESLEDNELRGTIFPPTEDSAARATAREHQAGRHVIPFLRAPGDEWTSNYDNILNSQCLPAKANMGHQGRQAPRQALATNTDLSSLTPPPKASPSSHQRRAIQQPSQPRASDTQASPHRSHARNVSFDVPRVGRSNSQLRNHLRTNRYAEASPNTVGSSSQGYYTYKSTQQSRGSPVFEKPGRTHANHISDSRDGPNKCTTYIDHNVNPSDRSDMATSGQRAHEKRTLEHRKRHSDHTTYDVSPIRDFERNGSDHSAVHVIADPRNYTTVSRSSTDNSNVRPFAYFQPHNIVPMLEQPPRDRSRLGRSKSTPRDMYNSSWARSTATEKKDLSEKSRPAPEDDTSTDLSAYRARSPTKRSRSPMKQMFGDRGWLHRGNSMNQIAGQKPKLLGFRNLASKVIQKADNKAGCALFLCFDNSS